MRRHYLDNIRWITVALVVFYHVIYIYNGVATFGVVGPFQEKQYQDAVLYILYPWFMLLLFIVAGISSRLFLEKHTVKEFIRSRSRKLLVPSTIGVFVLGWAQGYISMQISNAFEQMPDNIPKVVMYFIMTMSGIGVLWFAQLLWLFSMILAFIKKFEKGKLYSLCSKANIAVVLLLIIPVYLSGLVLNAPVITVYRFGFYGMGFFLGYFVFAHEEVIDRIVKIRFILSAAAVILGAVNLVLNFGKNYAEPPVLNGVITVAYAYIMCLAIFAMAKSYGNKTTKVSSFMSQRSFGLYVFHYLTMSAAAYLLNKYSQTPAILCYLIVLIAAYFGGLLMYEIISRIPIIRWCVLGIKKEKPKKAIADK